MWINRDIWAGAKGTPFLESVLEKVCRCEGPRAGGGKESHFTNGDETGGKLMLRALPRDIVFNRSAQRNRHGGHMK